MHLYSQFEEDGITVDIFMSKYFIKTPIFYIKFSHNGKVVKKETFRAPNGTLLGMSNDVLTVLDKKIEKKLVKLKSKLENVPLIEDQDTYVSNYLEIV